MGIHEQNQSQFSLNSEANTEGDSGGSPLPCLNSNISNEIKDPIAQKPSKTGFSGLSTQHRKTAFILGESVDQIGRKFGIENLGFLTLTFAQHIVDPKEAQRRLNSLITGVIKVRYREYLGVFERQKSGRIHYHILLVLDSDIRTGVDFEAFHDCDYRTAGKFLRSEWAFWRKTAKKYGFGRTELLPVRSSMQAMGKYVSKYISKHIEQREDSDKGVRLVRYSKGARVGTTRFQFSSEGSFEWRRKVAIFAALIESGDLPFQLCRVFPDYDRHAKYSVTSLSDISKALVDKRWAYKAGEFIVSLP